ncbi:MAG TPA: phosphoribosyltransferase [Fimbriimonas sp.]
MSRPFRNRKEAGEQLAKALLRFRDENPIVLGLARGGIVVAEPVARALGAPLDPLVARKVGAPKHPEFGMGAVAPGGVRYANPETLQMLGMSEADFDRYARREEAEVQRRLDAYLGGRSMTRLAGRCAILVDDGLATGVTAVAATRYVRSQRPASTVMAVPVASHQGMDLLSREVDEVVSLLVPEAFYAVGQWYEDFAQTSDEEVVSMLMKQHATLE